METTLYELDGRYVTEAEFAAATAPAKAAYAAKLQAKELRRDERRAIESARAERAAMRSRHEAERTAMEAKHAREKAELFERQR